MTAKEEKILQRAIDRSVGRGWNKRGFDEVSLITGSYENEMIQGIQLSYKGEEELAKYLSIFDLIYSHDFAKSLWGDKIVCSNCGKSFDLGQVVCTAEACVLKDHDMGELPLWAYNLQRMVLTEDPVLYMAKHI